MIGAERTVEAVKKMANSLGKYKFVLLVLLAGLILLMLPVPFNGENQSAAGETKASVEFTFSLSELERKLEETLSKIEGAGDVTVALTLRSGTRQVLAQDIAVSDRSGEETEERTTVVISSGSGREEAVSLQELAPQFQGAVVVCPGGDNPAVQLRLAEAVSDLTGLGADKISICKGK